MLKPRNLLGFTFSISLIAAGSAMGGGSGVNNGPLPDGCVKFQGQEIGEEQVAKTVAGATITLFDWVEKTDAPGEFIGFSFIVEGGNVVFSVKSGKDIHEGSSSPWVNPNGTDDGGTKAISNIVFCIEDGGGPVAPMGSDDPAATRFESWGTIKARFE